MGSHERVWQIASELNIINAFLVLIFLPESMTPKQDIQEEEEEYEFYKEGVEEEGINVNNMYPKNVSETKTNWFEILTSLRFIDYVTICVCFCHAVSFFSQMIYITHYMKNELHLNEKIIGWIRFCQTATAILAVLCYSYFEKCASHMMLMTVGTGIQTLGAILTAVSMPNRDEVLFCMLHIFSYSFTAVVFAAIGSTLTQRSNGLGVVLSANKTVETFAFGLGAVVSGFLYTNITFETPYYFAAGFSASAFVITIFAQKFGKTVVKDVYL